MSTIRRFWAPFPSTQRNYDIFGLNKGARIFARNSAEAAGKLVPVSLNPPPPFTNHEFDHAFFDLGPAGAVSGITPIFGLLSPFGDGPDAAG
jgi:hypothetical protein